MKPLGFRKMLKEANSLDKMPSKKMKKWKKGARQEAKKICNNPMCMVNDPNCACICYECLWKD